MSVHDKQIARLRIESADGLPANDYRINDGTIEVRTLDPSGRRFPGRGSAWRMLDDNDIQLHYALKTVVSKWLRVRLGEDENVLDRAA